MPKPRRGVHPVPVRPVQPIRRTPRWGLSSDVGGADPAALLVLALVALARTRPDRRPAAPAAPPQSSGLSSSPTAGRVSVQQLAGRAAPAAGTVWHTAPGPAQGSQPPAVTPVTGTAAAVPPVAGSSGAAAPAPAGRGAEPDLPVVAGGQVNGIATVAEALTGQRIRVLAEGPGGQVRGVLAAVVGNLLILCDDDRVIWVNLPDVQAIATGPRSRARRGAGGGSGSSDADAPCAPAQGAEVDADAAPLAPEGATLPDEGTPGTPDDPDAGQPEPTDGEGDARTGRRSASGPRSYDPVARVLWPPTWELVSVYRART